MSEDLRNAIAEAVEQAGAPVIEDFKEDPPAAPGEGETSEREPVPSTEAPTEPVDDGEAVEVPDVYWGVPLDGIEPEKRSEIIAHFEQQDSTIRQLQAKLAETPEPVVQEAPVPAEEVSDEDLLIAAGYDPEDYEVQNNAKFLVPSLRRQLALEDQLSAITRREEVSQVEQAWNGALDELEAAHGKLPFDRIQVLGHAVKEGIASPYELYFKLSAPIKQEVENAVTAARREAAKKAAQGGLTPATGKAGADPVQPGMTLREAVKASAEAAEKETGLSWESVLKRG